MKIEYELEALHRNLLSALGDYYVTKKQVGALVYLMLQGMPDRKDRNLRIAVLRAWIAEPMLKMHNVDVQSTKNITGPMASFLIELLKKPNDPEITLSNYGYELIEATVKYVKTTGATTQVKSQSKKELEVSSSARAQTVGS